MKVLAISLTLLLCQLRNILAHAIPRIEPSNASNIYEVQENNATTLRLINPKPEEPVLREIVYYHVIERAYGSGGNQDNQIISDKEPDFDDTRRPFTNGHGFPLPDETNETNIEEQIETNEGPKLVQEQLIDVPVEKDSDPNDLVPEPDQMTEDEVSRPEGVYFYEIVDGEEVPVYYYYDDEMPEDAQQAEEIAVQETPEVTTDDNDTEKGKAHEVPKDKPEENADIKDTDGDNVEIASDEVTEAPDPVIAVDDVIIEVTEATDPVVAVDDVIIEVTEATDPVVAVDEVIIEKMKARNQLFENLKEKYEQKLKHNVSNDEKSSSRRKRNVKIPEAPMLPELNYDMFPEYIRKIISTEKPPTNTIKSLDHKLEKFDDVEEDLKEEMENKIEAILENLKPLEAESCGSEEKATRTYGMNLTGDHGYVWNDLWTNPGISYDVGHIVDHKDNEYVNKPEPLDSNEEVFELPDETDSNEDESQIDENLDIFVDIDKRKDIKEELPKDDQNKPEIYVDIVENKEESKDIPDDKINENIENKDKEVDQIYIEEEKEINKVDEAEILEEKDDIGHKPEKDESKEPKEDNKGMDKKPDTLDELMKNEQFWKWLAEWTSTYMELLTKHIKKIVKEEVDNQMKVYIESHKDDNPKNNKDEISIESKKEEDVEIKEPIEKPVIKNDTIIIDGKEIPITHNTNFDQEELLKRRKDQENKLPILPIPTVNVTNIPVPVNNITVEQNKAPIRISAQTIYGNSAGNDKVTNIFIFYNNKDSENIGSDLKPNNDTVNNTFVFGQKDNATKENKVIELPKVDEIVENNLEEINKVFPSNNNDKNKEPIENLSSKDQEDSNVSNEVSDKTKEPTVEKDLTLEENKTDDKEIKEEEPKDKIIEQNKDDNQIENKEIHEETKEPNKEENQQIIEDSKKQSNEEIILENKEESKDQNQEEHKEETKEAEQIENKDGKKDETKIEDNVNNKENGKEPNKEENNEDKINEAKDKDETKETNKVENKDETVEEPKDENKPDIEETNADNKEVNSEKHR